MMIEETKRYYNEVRNIKAVCRTTNSWVRGEFPELELGKTYEVTHIGVLRSSTNIMLKEHPSKEYTSTCFDLYEHNEPFDYLNDPRFLAPYIRNECRKDSSYVKDEIEGIAIPAHLKSIEMEYDIRILLAVESGSRAWGFESCNSDWDVRFIYVHKPKWYFQIEEQRDVIEHVYDDDIDLVGWELRKALSLLRKSNPTLLEWINSPKVYYVDEDFKRRLLGVQDICFNPVKAMYHYNRIYNKDNERHLQHGEYHHMKKFFYYLRGILACKWIEINQSIPPVRFQELLEATIDDAIIKERILQLIKIKKDDKECKMIIIESELVDYAKELASYYNETVSAFRPEQHYSTTDVLDEILYDMVNMNFSNELK